MVYLGEATAQYTAVMAISIENVANWEVNISGYCSHIEKKKIKEETEKKNLEPGSNLTRDSKVTRATNKLFTWPCNYTQRILPTREGPRSTGNTTLIHHFWYTFVAVAGFGPK